jgi:exonuclease SbcC
MKLDKIHLVNFLSYTDEKIDLTSVNIAAIVGENGSGKSSLIEAITYALFGKTRAKSDDELSKGYDNLNKAWKVDKFSVELEFIINNTGYLIRRAKTESGTKLSFQHAYKIPEDEGKQDLSGVTLKETEAVIKDVIGMDYESFISSVILKQNEYDALLEMSPAECKKILMRVIGIEEFEKKSDSVKKLANEIEIEYSTIISKVQDIKEELVKIENVDEQVKKNEDMQKEYQSKILEAETTLDGLNKKYLDVKKKYDSQSENLLRLRQIEKESNKLSSQITEVENDLEGELSDAKKDLEAVLESKDKFPGWVDKNKQSLIEQQEKEKEALVTLTKTREQIKQIDNRITELQANKQVCLMSKEECNKEWKTKVGCEVTDKRKQIDDLKKKLEDCLTDKEVVRAEIEKLNEKAVRLQSATFALKHYEHLKTLKDSEKKIAAEKTKLEDVEIGSLLTDDDVTSLEIQIRKKKDFKKSLDVELQECQKYAGELKANINRKNALEERLEGLRDRKNLLKTKKEVYEVLVKAFGKDGIPAIMISNIVPILEKNCNEILSKLSEGKISVEFRLEKKLKGGGFSDSFEIFVTDEEGTRSVRMFSGGERFRIVFAIHSSFSRYLTRRSKTEVRLLVIDEPSGLDGDGLERLIEVLGVLRKDYEQIFIISHLKELTDSFENVLYVSKDGKGSHVSQKEEIELVEDL